MEGEPGRDVRVRGALDPRWWVALLAVPVILTAVAVLVRQGAVEDSLQKNVQSALIGGGVPGARVDVSGRDAEVRLPDGASLPKAQSALEDVPGLRSVGFSGSGTSALGAK